MEFFLLEPFFFLKRQIDFDCFGNAFSAIYSWPMTRKTLPINSAVKQALQHLKKKMGSDFLAGVIITCSPPDQEGEMEVEMHFDGDEVLISFLLENGAQSFQGKEEEIK